MSTSQLTDEQKKKIGLIIKIVLGIAVAFWLMKSCDRQREARDIEMKGRALLEQKGYYAVPPGAGTEYYFMRWDGNLVQDDYQMFFRRLTLYKLGLGELTKRGLDPDEADDVPEYDIYEAFESDNPKAAFDYLARRYD